MVSVQICEEHYLFAMECGMTVRLHSTKLPQSLDIQSEQFGVPA